MSQYHVKYTVGGELNLMKLKAASFDEVEKLVKKYIPEAENIRVQSYGGYLDEQIRNHIDKIAIDTGRNDDEYHTRIKERLRCCADAAYMFGEDSQESLERTFGRMAECKWSITGLDSHMFSFGFKSPAGFWGGIIFHCHSKTWSAHT